LAPVTRDGPLPRPTHRVTAAVRIVVGIRRTELSSGTSTRWAPAGGPPPMPCHQIQSFMKKKTVVPIHQNNLRPCIRHHSQHDSIRRSQTSAGPHPPSLAWVETPLPLGPLPLPPGPLNAKHSKRAQGAVFNGTHSPVRSEPSSPTPGSSLCAGGSRTWRGPPVRSRRLTTNLSRWGYAPSCAPRQIS
jgi:hypothetical protein